MYDILIIGAGVTGCAIARELSRYDAKIAVLEKGHDVAMGSSKANSAIVHAGYDAKPGTNKAAMNLAGNAMFDQLAKDLEFPFVRNGSLILCFDENDRPELEKLLARGIQNGVQGLEIVERARLEEMEPHIGPKAVAALWAPTGGIVCPYEMTIALAENAAENGAEFFFGQAVTGLEKKGDTFVVTTEDAVYESKIIINAAGLFADVIHNMLAGADDQLEIQPRSGQYLLLDKKAGYLAGHTLFQLPTAMGKGILVTPTVDGNLLLGPTAVDVEDKHDVATYADQHREIIEIANLSVENLPVRQGITSFTGLRAHCTRDDFVLGHVPGVRGMIDAAGIESPGLTSAPAIGTGMVKFVGELMTLTPKENFIATRRSIPKFREMSRAEQAEMIAENPLYGKIICRCETVSEGEIVAAIHRPLGARTLDSIKRRTRSGMGRCQGGFCAPQITAILARELKIPMTAVTKTGPGTELLVGRNREI